MSQGAIPLSQNIELSPASKLKFEIKNGLTFQIKGLAKDFTQILQRKSR